MRSLSLCSRPRNSGYLKLLSLKNHFPRKVSTQENALCCKCYKTLHSNHLTFCKSFIIYLNQIIVVKSYFFMIL